MTTCKYNEEVADLVEVVCLQCGRKLYMDPDIQSFHNFCGDTCENKWRDNYAEFVDVISVNP